MVPLSTCISLDYVKNLVFVVDLFPKPKGLNLCKKVINYTLIVAGGFL